MRDVIKAEAILCFLFDSSHPSPLPGVERGGVRGGN